MAPRTERFFSFGRNCGGLDLGRELDRLYGARYASLPHFEIYCCEPGLHVYVASAGDVPEAILVFRIRGRVLTVLNEGIVIDEATANRAAAFMFASFPHVAALSFRFVEIAGSTFAHACQCTPADTDMMLPLPASVDAYRASLGSRTRGNLTNQLNKFRRTFPGQEVRIYENGDIPPELVRNLIAMQRGRMADVGKVSMVHEDEEQRVCEYAARRGFVVAILVGGRLAAGTINYRLGRNFTARIIGHDPAYASYHIGFLATYLTVCECIKAEPGGMLHFGWGHGDYKYRLGGKDRQLSHLTLYRSRLHVMFILPQALVAQARGQTQRARRWALAAEQDQDRFTGRAVRALLRTLRRIRAVAQRLGAQGANRGRAGGPRPT